MVCICGQLPYAQLPRSAAESRSDRGKGCAIMCDLQTPRSRSFQISQHLSQHLTCFTRHCAKTDHAESTHCGAVAARYSCTVLVSLGTVPSVSTPCALGDSETHNAGSVGNQSQSACQMPHSACVRRPIRFPTVTDCRLYHRACLLSETIYRA